MRASRWLFALLGLVAATFVIYGAVVRESGSNDSMSLVRQAAIRGLNETAKRLVSDSTSWSADLERYASGETAMGEAQYSTVLASPYGAPTVENGCTIDTVDVVSTGAVDDGDSHMIEATYVRTCGENLGIRLVRFAER